ncbi:Nucleolar protein [Schistosoma japonicum]|uniref:Nucleolar protein n=2 Tax=Schistosoma japonicum TaxID=6182 RepID=Q5DH15_SCHJA|nr:SJCHGC09422 protein [Schistosoma japonicum]TNN16155.1 Nucleolar protein [Schistosoma japonicum]
MNVIKINGVKVYNLTANRALPEWASKSEKRKKKSGGELSRRIELIQELEMPDSTSYLASSPDGQYLFALGRYKPRVKCYELSNLSMKFDRCLDCMPYKLVCLSDNYSKFALLEEERWVEIHAAGGHHFKFRVPKQGVDLDYCPGTCDLFVASSRDQIYRMDLSEGRFKTSLVSQRLESSSHGFTACGFEKNYSLLFGASTIGCVDGWDTRTSEHVFGLNVCKYAPAPEDLQNSWRSTAVTCMSFKDPLNFAVGTGDGVVYIYDVRQNRKPWHVRDTEYREPIKSIYFHDDKVLAALRYCCKVWSLDTGKIFVGFNTGPAECNSMYHFPNSGLLMFASESPKISTYFIPLLGAAPFWCSYLDSLVVECEPDVTTMYDGYKFITHKQLSDLGMSELIGTQFLRAYMHGYFISANLYNRIQDHLGITQRPSTHAKSKSPDISKVSLRSENIIAEFNEASADQRFSKLSDNPKLAYSTIDGDSDLIQIHQARLEKKRRRKEIRKERAARAHSLIKNVSNVHT